MAEHNCAPELYKRGEASLSEASSSWRLLVTHQTLFGVCDDGALSEGYSEAVVKLFADHWDQSVIFDALAKRNSGFRLWAINHIDATASDQDLNKIVANTKQCKKLKMKGLCEEIRQAAINAANKITKRGK
jgi:hypothetical protein